ncbi:unnamed protein product [Rangifer tarandus platyrhynchus]|uniref:Uncharacterized protein n=1 Tax=Rangifer tarandus platyrhynchus TaxID=3082113 RepID=A0AC60A4I1_RANTA
MEAPSGSAGQSGARWARLQGGPCRDWHFSFGRVAPQAAAQQWQGRHLGSGGRRLQHELSSSTRRDRLSRIWAFLTPFRKVQAGRSTTQTLGMTTVTKSERNRMDSTNCLAAWSRVKVGFLPSVPKPPDPGQHRSQQQGDRDGPLSPVLNKVNTFL